LRIEDAGERSPDEWTTILEHELEAAQNRLAAGAMTRDPAGFTTLLDGRVGVGFFYDTCRRLKAWMRGERFDAAHDDRTTGAVA
jgi:hypothetical protein